MSKIKSRCNNPNDQDYIRYGGRGIKCLITSEELEKLWFRDKAYLMKKPSIDREDNDGNYIYSNCCFIEHAENAVKDKRKPVLQYDLDGNFVREWSSVNEAGRQLKIHSTNISKCCNMKLKSTNRCLWKHKENKK